MPRQRNLWVIDTVQVAAGTQRSRTVVGQISPSGVTRHLENSTSRSGTLKAHHDPLSYRDDGGRPLAISSLQRRNGASHPGKPKAPTRSRRIAGDSEAIQVDVAMPAGFSLRRRDGLKMALLLTVTGQLQRPAARGANPVFSGYVVGLDLAESRLGQEIAVLRVAEER